MGVLQRFERRLEGLVNGAFARAFKSEVQPVEIASALQRECDDRAAIVSRGRTIVPNDFAVELGRHDYDRLSTYAATLVAELGGMVQEHAQEQGYAFVGPIDVRFECADDLETGMFRVRSQALAGVVPMRGAPPGPPGPHGGSPGPQRAPSAWLEINNTPQPLTQPVTTIGRGTDVDLRIDDPGVSRRHAQIRTGTSAVIIDLGSTNGVVVNGQQVQQAPLDNGSVIVLGSTTLVFRRDPG